MRSSRLKAWLRHSQSTKKTYYTTSSPLTFTPVTNQSLFVYKAKLPCSNLISNCRRRQFSTNQEDKSIPINTNESSNKTYQDDIIQTDNTIIFPWRESATTPLPRVTSNDNLSGLNMSSSNKFVIKLASCVELHEFSFWNFFITRQWENDLAYNASWAFQMAVAGLVSRTFGLPLDSIENTLEGGLVVDTSDDALNIPKQSQENDKDDDNIESNKENEIDESSTFIQNMIENKLLSLYQPISSSSSKNNLNKYEVTFLLKPLTSRLENIFMIPSLTRQDVNLNPSLKGAYSAIDKAYREKGSVEDINAMSKELFRKTPHSGSKRSLIMDVSIDCAEIFQIKDLANGKIVQGSTTDDLEPEKTTHVVRFEMVTSKGKKKGERILGSWIVIDIDDRLNGNTWH